MYNLPTEVFGPTFNPDHFESGSHLSRGSLSCCVGVRSPSEQPSHCWLSYRHLPVICLSPRRVSSNRQCSDCHTGSDGEGGFDIGKLTDDLADRANRENWVRAIDRVEAGEMPPPDSGKLARRAIERFVDQAGDSVLDYESKERATRGRVFARRLTNLQLERSLHDVLGIDIPLATLLPDEQRTGGYTTVAAGQTMSHFDLQNHMTVVDAALAEAFRRATTRRTNGQKTSHPKTFADGARSLGTANLRSTRTRPLCGHTGWCFTAGSADNRS